MREIRFSQHALERMRQRGVTAEQVRSVVQVTTPFRYSHAGIWKTGYFDPEAKIFVAKVGNMVTTVMTGVAPAYVEALRRGWR